jgi:hypothetical protein
MKVSGALAALLWLDTSALGLIFLFFLFFLWTALICFFVLCVVS